MLKLENFSIDAETGNLCYNGENAQYEIYEAGSGDFCLSIFKNGEIQYFYLPSMSKGIESIETDEKVHSK